MVTFPHEKILLLKKKGKAFIIRAWIILRMQLVSKETFLVFIEATVLNKHQFTSIQKLGLHNCLELQFLSHVII